MRQIILDTETTGIGHELGHKIIEIGCVELIDRQFTGNHFHIYLNPQREVDEGAFRVHGISTAFLQDKPLFKSIVPEFLDYIAGAELIIHNAPFDLGFLNAELKQASHQKSIADYCKVFDTLVYARKKHPGLKNNLDALCKRYNVDNSNRDLHGALLDAEILGFVYLAMTGGQGDLFAVEEVLEKQIILDKPETTPVVQDLFVVLPAEAEELKSHQEFVTMLTKKSGTEYWVES